MVSWFNVILLTYLIYSRWHWPFTFTDIVLVVLPILAGDSIFAVRAIKHRNCLRNAASDAPKITYFLSQFRVFITCQNNDDITVTASDLRYTGLYAEMIERSDGVGSIYLDTVDHTGKFRSILKGALNKEPWLPPSDIVAIKQPQGLLAQIQSTIERYLGSPAIVD